MWEPGLLAMAVCQSMNVWAGPPLSQASQLPHFDLRCGKFTRLYSANVGAGLAREGGVSVDEVVAGPPLSQASQLPHFDLQCGKFIRQYAVNVGAGLAREGGVSVDECMGWYAAIAGKPAPTF